MAVGNLLSASLTLTDFDIYVIELVVADMIESVLF